jgi:hypothetical protein
MGGGPKTALAGKNVALRCEALRGAASRRVVMRSGAKRCAGWFPTMGGLPREPSRGQGSQSPCGRAHTQELLVTDGEVIDQ